MGWVMVDDLTGVPITDGAGGPVRITVDDDSIEIDLSTSGRDDLIEILKPYFNAGRPAAKPTAGPTRTPAAPRSAPPAEARRDGEPTDAEVRAWAREQGMEISAIGRVRNEFRDAYRRAHAGQAPTEAAPAPAPAAVAAPPKPQPPRAVPAAPSSARPPVQDLDRPRPEQLEKAEEMLADDEPVHTVATATGMTVAQVRDLKAAIERGAAAS